MDMTAMIERLLAAYAAQLVEFNKWSGLSTIATKRLAALLITLLLIALLWLARLECEYWRERRSGGRDERDGGKTGQNGQNGEDGDNGQSAAERATCLGSEFNKKQLALAEAYLEMLEPERARHSLEVIDQATMSAEEMKMAQQLRQRMANLP